MTDETDRATFFGLPYSQIGLACRAEFLSEGAHVNSTLKITQKSEPITLIEKIEAELKKRAELKAKRMLLRVPRRLAKR